MAGANSNLVYNPPYQAPAGGGGVTYSGGGGGLLLSGARDILDARRMMETGHVPTAAYPDGYLGTLGGGDRREDRLLGAVANRATQRSYQRGVHKGERIDPADYYWTEQVNPAAALIAQAEGRKWTQQGSTIGAPLVNDGKSATLVSSQARFATAERVYSQETTPPFTSYDAQRRAQLMRFKPDWT
ncbi:hypothetical protein ACIGXM_14100 [Kitasatospora sp. NPDC052896]|uniref:hypothetical protein n=1 Tax=Kitasatospora sp. NPDC052896 TaxID=3364061 RepID=UPI0037CC43BA